MKWALEVPDRSPRRFEAPRARGGRALAAVGFAAAVVLGFAGCTGTVTGSESWSDPSVTSRSSRVVTVLAHGVATGDGACTPRVHLTTVETQATVSIRASTMRRTGGTVTCAASLIGPQPFIATLRRSLGDRDVIDAATGRSAPLLDGSALPTITDLPAGCRQRSIERTQHGALVRGWRSRTGGGYPGVTLTIGPVGSGTRFPHSTTVQVGGRPVQLWSAGGDTSQTFAATWTPKAGQQAQIVVDARTGTLDAARVLDLVAHTARL